MKRSYWIIVLLSVLFIIISSFFVDVGSVLEYRIYGAIITVLVVIILWIIMFIELFKSEPKQINVNMSDRYVELSLDKLKVLGVNYEKFKLMIYQRFKDIHLAYSNFDYDILKLNLTNDLYKYYVQELDDMKSKSYKNIIKDIELVELKVYDINDTYGVLNISVYLNVRMYDYIINEKTHECVFGDNIDKTDFEFELMFINNNEDNTSKYVMTKKSCINKMKIKK